MPDNSDHFLSEQDPEAPSKSELKRQMTARQVLGEALAALGDKQLAKIPIEDDRLVQAIRELRQIRSNSARRRHLQYIGKLMRDVDPGPLEQALLHQRNQQQQVTDVFHTLERLREEVLAEGVAGVEKIMLRWPDADRQHLRQLLLLHQREQQQGKPPGASRKLFKYLRELQQTEDSSD